MAVRLGLKKKLTGHNILAIREMMQDALRPELVEKSSLTPTQLCFSMLLCSFSGSSNFEEHVL